MSGRSPERRRDTAGFPGRQEHPVRRPGSGYATNLTDTRALLALDRERGTLARVGYLNHPRTMGVTLRFSY